MSWGWYSIAGLQKNDKRQTHELLLLILSSHRTFSDLAGFFLLQRIQDEVHRFAITFHRQLRSKNSFSSQLDGIEGFETKTQAVAIVLQVTQDQS